MRNGTVTPSASASRSSASASGSRRSFSYRDDATLETAAGKPLFTSAASDYDREIAAASSGWQCSRVLARPGRPRLPSSLSPPSAGRSSRWMIATAHVAPAGKRARRIAFFGVLTKRDEPFRTGITVCSRVRGPGGLVPVGRRADHAAGAGLGQVINRGVGYPVQPIRYLILPSQDRLRSVSGTTSLREAHRYRCRSRRY